VFFRPDQLADVKKSLKKNLSTVVVGSYPVEDEKKIKRSA
jgi:hypothetical protein